MSKKDRPPTLKQRLANALAECERLKKERDEWKERGTDVEPLPPKPPGYSSYYDSPKRETWQERCRLAQEECRSFSSQNFYLKGGIQALAEYLKEREPGAAAMADFLAPKERQPSTCPQCGQL